MREIKFRAWNQEQRKMMYELEVLFANKLRDIFEQLDDFNFPYMQYTGIKDEHGSEIYEGDILKWSSEDTDGSMMESLEKVVYRDGCFVLENEYGKITDLLKDGIKYNEEYEKVELVGNVYENAELLEGDHNE